MILIKFGNGQSIIPKDFWKSIWDFTKVKGSFRKYFTSRNLIFFIRINFFLILNLNYAENLLKKNNDKTCNYI